ncbi:FUSC family protein [Eubacterium oxidoreducens]|uniref:Fusaric acid resistance protein-like n=1 Tax=Eubacterium oxidoreducens TaxID=1732 RepID=A0A1G6CFU1_EUBOX|nr:FUSC family protein [Eubacterium oxidoreducens]SDB31675.1 Fusaric acid resistance protein-like [Eubacterium oxidoreducens]
MEKTISERLLSSVLVCGYLFAVCILGVFTKNMIVLIPFVYAAVIFSSYVFWLKTEMKFPFYVHIGMTYLVLCHLESLSVKNWILVWTAIASLAILAQMVLGIKNHESFGKDSALKVIYERYRLTVSNNKKRLYRTTVHTLILFFIAWSELLFYDYRGYWIMISACAVFIGEDYGRIQIRGLRRIAGAFLGFAVGWIIMICNAGTISCIACFVCAVIVTAIVMPDKYILGSAGISLQAVCGYAMSEGSLTLDLLSERLVWTIVGASLAILLCMLSDKIFNSLYEDKTRYKLIER